MHFRQRPGVKRVVQGLAGELVEEGVFDVVLLRAGGVDPGELFTGARDDGGSRERHAPPEGKDTTRANLDAPVDIGHGDDAALPRARAKISIIAHRGLFEGTRLVLGVGSGHGVRRHQRFIDGSFVDQDEVATAGQGKGAYVSVVWYQFVANVAVHMSPKRNHAFSPS